MPSEISYKNSQQDPLVLFHKKSNISNISQSFYLLKGIIVLQIVFSRVALNLILLIIVIRHDLKKVGSILFFLYAKIKYQQ